MGKRIKDLAILLLASAILALFLGFVILKGLFQNIASETFSFERMFSHENVIETLLIYGAIILIVLPIYFLFRKK